MLQLVGDHASGDGAEQLAIFTGLDLDDADQFLHRLGQLGHVVEFMSFAFSAALAKCFKTALVGLRDGDGKALRDEIIARVAGGDFDLVGFTAEAHDVVREDDFSFCHTKLKV